MIVANFALIGCNPNQDGASSAAAPKAETKQGTAATPAKQNEQTKTFTYSEGSVREVIEVSFSKDGKKVLGGTYSKAGSSDKLPITFVDMEYVEDATLFMGGATCSAWKGEAMVGIDGDFSRLSLIDDATMSKKIFKK